MHLSYTAMSGKPVVRDNVTRAILSGMDLSVFAGIGAFKEHHLRILVTMPRTSLRVLKMVASESATNPAKAIDYCSSAAMARVLIDISGDVSCFALYNQPTFVDGYRLHDYGKGADRFRLKDVVYEVLCERIRYGGDVLPAHVGRWFKKYGRDLMHAYMLKRGSLHMRKCYDICERQAFNIYEKPVSPVECNFMVAYHRYTKYLPLKMFYLKIFAKKQVVAASVKDMVDKGYTCEQVELYVGGREMREISDMADLKKSAEGKKKKRRLARAIKSKAVKELLDTVNRIFGLGCCEGLIFSFL